ncbi:4128_t:CDS:2, partial [Cetraspora pellucida]
MVQTQLGEGHDLLTELLFASQQFIRSIEEKYSVSLRDVKRAIKLVLFFSESLQSRSRITKIKNHSPNTYPPHPENPGRINFLYRCYILALSLCYQSRIYDQESRNEQDDWVKIMQLPPNTAINEPLLENVLVMIVCILTKIPVFIIGVPGSSKSLAIKLVGQNLRGTDSNDRYFRKLPQVYLISYQGSSSSTSDGIIKVFAKAIKYQETRSKEFSVINVVVLDNVLHELLEPNYPSDGPAVSVVGISNWRLDNSKSSRALLIQRPKFGIDDLIDTAVRLLDSKLHCSITRASVRPLAEAYSEYEECGQSHSNFHGLRDYYGLVKSLSKSDLTPENVQMALERNFGGTDRNENSCEVYFDTVLRTFNNDHNWTYEPIPTLTLIKTNLDDESARHLMDDQQDYSYNVMCVETGRSLILTDLEIIYGSFIGFDENETLQGLVIDIMTKFPDDNEEEIVKRCKAALIDIASSDGIIRATKSSVDPGEINLWNNVYFRNVTDEHIPRQNHDCL